MSKITPEGTGMFLTNFLKHCTFEAAHKVVGSLFHNCGPKTANDLSPKDLFVTGMARRVKSLEDLSP